MRKPIFVILGGISWLTILFAGSIYSLSKHIYNRTDCVRFNIDNIESRTEIDIPQAISSECDCKDVPKMKESTFVLDKTSARLSTTIYY